MLAPISLEKSVAAQTAAPTTSSAQAAGGKDFAEVLKGLVSETNQEVVQAEDQARLLAEGKAGIVETVLAMNKADLSMRFVVELRNRFVEAYREVTRLQA